MKRPIVLVFMFSIGIDYGICKAVVSSGVPQIASDYSLEFKWISKHTSVRMVLFCNEWSVTWLHGNTWRGSSGMKRPATAGQ